MLLSCLALLYVLTETLLLLTSSFICGLAMLAVHQRRKTMAMALFFVTFLLGDRLPGYGIQ